MQIDPSLHSVTYGGNALVLTSTIKLVVEVISTNWETDYARKFEDYETMGIQGTGLLAGRTPQATASQQF